MGQGLSIETLIDEDDNWKIESAYNRKGDNALFLFSHDDIEIDISDRIKANLRDINDTVADGLSDPEVLDSMYHQFMKEYPDQPFIIMKPTYKEAVDEMNKRLAKIGSGNDLIELLEEFMEFESAIYLACEDSSLKTMYQGHYDGWRSILNEVRSAEKK